MPSQLLRPSRPPRRADDTYHSHRLHHVGALSVRPRTPRALREASHDVLSLSAYDQFCREARQVIPLTPTEEAQLLRQVALGQRERGLPAPNSRLVTDGLAARDRLLEGYQPVILAYARRFQRFCDPAMTVLDLAQEGTVGVLNMLATYVTLNPPVAPRVGAWVVPHVRWTLQHAVWRSMGGMRVPRHVARLLTHLRDAQDMLLATLHREPTEQEVATALGLSLPYVRDLLLLRRQRVVSFDRLLGEGYAFDADSHVHEVCASLDSCGSESDLAADPDTSQGAEWGDRRLSPRLREAMCLLSPRERAFVRLRFGFTDGYARTQHEIASELGISPVTAERLSRRALNALREALAASPNALSA